MNYAIKWIPRAKLFHPIPSIIHTFTRLLNLAHEVRLEAAWRIVPLETLAVAIPQLQAVLLLVVLVPEVVRFARIPVGERDRSAGGHPEEAALVRQIGARRPEVLVAETWKATKSINCGTSLINSNERIYLITEITDVLL